MAVPVSTASMSTPANACRNSLESSVRPLRWLVFYTHRLPLANSTTAKTASASSLKDWLTTFANAQPVTQVKWYVDWVDEDCVLLTNRRLSLQESVANFWQASALPRTVLTLRCHLWRPNQKPTSRWSFRPRKRTVSSSTTENRSTLPSNFSAAAFGSATMLAITQFPTCSGNLYICGSC